MGGDKKKNQQKAIQVADQNRIDEQSRADKLQSQLNDTKSNLTEDVYGAGGARDLVKQGAQNLAITGGYDPNQVSNLRNQISQTGSSEGYGREGYQNLADTGGYSDSEKTDYLEHAIAPTIAAYGRNHDELTRHLAINGGYNPGFTSGEDRLVRHEAQDVASANQTGRVNLAQQIQSNKQAGLAGLSSTQQAINSNKQAGINSGIGLESSIASGKVQGQEALQRYMDSGVQALTQNDITSLQNRLQTGQVSAADAQMLALIASQQKTLYESIMQGVGTVGAAIGGAAPAFK